MPEGTILTVHAWYGELITNENSGFIERSNDDVRLIQPAGLGLGKSGNDGSAFYSEGQ